jgi:pyruvate dehydrogenase E2 component (dihydrolipoamide acetyltransferase)
MSDEPIYALTMPKWGMAMDEGTVTDWHIEEGAVVEEGAEVLDVESTKIANGIEAKQAGVLRRRIAAVGDTLPVGGLLGVVAEASVSDAAIDEFVGGFEVETPDDDGAEAGPATETVMVGDRTIRFLANGEDDGVPVVLAHGFGGDLNTWMFNQPALADGRRVYALDLPGHGGSSKDVGDGSLDVLDDVLGGFMASLGIERAHLAGHSRGGAVALARALARPETVASVTLLASAGLGPEINGGYIDGFVAAERRKDMKAVLPALFADPKLVSRQMVDDVLKAKRIDGATEALGALAAAQFADGVQAVSLTARAGDLTMPVQVIWGADDAIIPASHANNLAGAKVTIIDDAGHMPHMEAAATVNALMTEFMTP